MIHIRKAILTDANFIINSQIAMALETEKMKLDLATVTLGVNAVLKEPAIGDYFVALENDKLVGCLLTLPEWSDWRNGKVLWVHSLYILPEYRGQRIFSQMYEHLKQMVANSANYRGLRLYVDKTNLSAQKIYQKLGMTKEHYDLFEWMK